MCAQEFRPPVGTVFGEECLRFYGGADERTIVVHPVPDREVIRIEPAVVPLPRDPAPTTPQEPEKVPS